METVDGSKTAKADVTVTNSIDVSGDGLLSEEDLTIIEKYQGSRSGDKLWAKAQTADINNDKKVDTKDLKMMSDKLAPYQDEFLYKRVVVIGIDGAGDAVKNPEANATNILKLMEEGAGTFEAKAMLPTISAQNWGAILHGVTPEKHELTNDIVASNPYPEKNAYPSYMKLLKQERPKLAQASFATWGSINIGIIEDSAGAGHNHGYFTPEFYEQLQKEDENVGDILKALEEKGLMEDTLVIVTTDHGGKGTGHGGSSEEEQTIFWAAKGASIKPGTELSQVRNMDTAAVVARALRPDIPKNWDAQIPKGLFEEQ